ncbi:hypothetical protein AVL63_05030 [Nesterenkonia jeotgali]|uniref:Uncharacterized protein n=1 Tax=Nesterenkonia jeotgali TaxID=317018 RepID=A0A0W8ID65_9MICC|nr:hypothetical protein AVL63_05030 [Nesterenkonia jeotgali]
MLSAGCRCCDWAAEDRRRLGSEPAEAWHQLQRDRKIVAAPAAAVSARSGLRLLDSAAIPSSPQASAAA